MKFQRFIWLALLSTVAAAGISPAAFAQCTGTFSAGDDTIVCDNFSGNLNTPTGSPTDNGSRGGGNDTLTATNSSCGQFAMDAGNDTVLFDNTSASVWLDVGYINNSDADGDDNVRLWAVLSERWALTRARAMMLST